METRGRAGRVVPGLCPSADRPFSPQREAPRARRRRRSPTSRGCVSARWWRPPHPRGPPADRAAAGSALTARSLAPVLCFCRPPAGRGFNVRGGACARPAWGAPAPAWPRGSAGPGCGGPGGWVLVPGARCPPPGADLGGLRSRCLFRRTRTARHHLSIKRSAFANLRSVCLGALARCAWRALLAGGRGPAFSSPDSSSLPARRPPRTPEDALGGPKLPAWTGGAAGGVSPAVRPPAAVTPGSGGGRDGRCWGGAGEGRGGWGWAAPGPRVEIGGAGPGAALRRPESRRAGRAGTRADARGPRPL